VAARRVPPEELQHRDRVADVIGSARICSTRFIGAIGGRCIGTIEMVYPGTLFHRRQRGIPMHFYENRSQIRALSVIGSARTDTMLERYVIIRSARVLQKDYAIFPTGNRGH
jgi:hypothetical protein